jgi:hypothetical protein
MTDQRRPLQGTLVLLIEEDSFSARYVGEVLVSAGAQIVGPARTALEAEALILRLRITPLAAVVSTNVFDAEGDGVSQALARLGAPLLLLQKGGRQLRPSFVRHDILTTPFAAYQIVDHLCGLRERAATGSPQQRSGPLMRGH